jgi:hypothetical protein
MEAVLAVAVAGRTSAEVGLAKAQKELAAARSGVGHMHSTVFLI